MSAQAATWRADRRLGGLRRFATAITLLNVLGHTVLGFEQSWAQPVVAVLTAYVVEIALEWVDARVSGRRPRFAGGGMRFVDFLLSAHISGLAVAMLLYANDRLMPIAFASAVAIGSKAIFRTSIEGRQVHFLNPSNAGISATLLLFPWIGIAPPYHFTENLNGWGDWALPAIIVVTGSLLNARFTQRLPLIGGWVAGFLLQAALRSAWFGTPLAASLVPMTGVAFVLYTFYMVTDPATTPSRTLDQVLFGLAVAATYGVLMLSHVVFGLFYSLSIVCVLRGLALGIRAASQRHRIARPTIPAPHAAYMPSPQPIAAAVDSSSLSR